jgi:hypothetical protein
MSTGTTNVTSLARSALEIALIVAAGTAIFFPELRTGTLRALVMSLFLAQATVVTYCGWKDGNLKLTPSELFQRIRQTGPFKRSRLENLSIFAGFIAVVVISWP